MARLLHNRRPRIAILVAAVAGLALAGLVGLAIAKTTTLSVAKNATVSNQTGQTSKANIVVNSRGRAVYTLSGDTKAHPKCTKGNDCFSFWPPVTAKSAKSLTKGAGVTGKLGTFKRNGFVQATLNGHPLYTFSQDSKRADATGEGLQTFGGTWHVVKGAGSATHSSSPTTTTTSSTTSTNPYGY